MAAGPAAAARGSDAGGQSGWGAHHGGPCQARNPFQRLHVQGELVAHGVKQAGDACQQRRLAAQCSQARLGRATNDMLVSSHLCVAPIRQAAADQLAAMAGRLRSSAMSCPGGKVGAWEWRLRAS